MKRTRCGTGSGAAWLSVVGLLLGGFMSVAGCTYEPPYDPLASGQASYKAYCESCHGADGTGLGEIVGDLHTIPSNLTDLAERNGGTYPADEVFQAIDGRRVIPAHGTREMPVWGNIWGYDEDTPVRSEVVEQQINELVEYIRSLQKNS